MTSTTNTADVDGDVAVLDAVETFQELFNVRAWTVLLHNDDVTPMDVVMKLLEIIFHMAPEAAEVVTMKVHNEGKCALGTFDRDIAETKATLMVENARQLGYPLMAEAAPIE